MPFFGLFKGMDQLKQNIGIAAGHNEKIRGKATTGAGFMMTTIFLGIMICGYSWLSGHETLPYICNVERVNHTAGNR